jgi:type IV secretion system protein VirB5
MIIRRKLVAGLVASVLASSVFATGIPVFNIEEALFHQVVQTVHYGEEIKQLVSQVQTAQSQLKAMQGVRKAADILALPGIQDQIPAQYQTIIDLSSKIQSGQLKDNFARNQALKQAISLIKQGKMQNKETDRAVQAMQSALSDDADMWTQAMKESDKSMARIQTLMDQIKASPDPKDIADLQARLASENQYLQVQQTRLNTAMSATQARMAILEQQEVERGKMMSKGRDVPVVNPFADAGS